MSRFMHIIDIKRAPSGATVWTRYKWTAPTKDFITLDESLDTGKVFLYPMDNKKVDFTPFTPIRFRAYRVPDMTYPINDMTDEQIAADVALNKIQLKKEFYRLVSNMTCEMHVPRYQYNDRVEPSNRKWLITLDTIEPTKLLERRVGRLLCFTNPLNKGYTENTTEISPFWGATDDTETPAIQRADKAEAVAWMRELMTDVPEFLSPLGVGHRMTLPPIGTIFKNEFIRTIETFPAQSTVTVFREIGFNTYRADEYNTIELYEPGTWTVVYAIKTEYMTGALWYRGYVTLSFPVSVVTEDSADYTITEVFTRILSSAVTRRLSTPQEFYLNGCDELHTLAGYENTYEKYLNVRAPEIVTAGTLWDMLLSAASNIHGIPRLNYNPQTDKFDTVTIDILGGTEVHPGFWDRLIAYTSTRSINDYCGEVDSSVENLIDTTDERSGTVVEPCVNGGKSVRAAASETIIKNDTALFRSTFPAYRTTKFEVKLAGTAGYTDITRFVYEESEWDALNNYSETFPLSRAYALMYKQGSQEIGEFTHKVENVSEFLEVPAIQNILQRVGISTPTNYTDLRFRLTYIPVIRARVKQKKAFIDPDYEGNSLIYNQGETQVESSSFGNGLGGYVEKVGQETIQATFMLEDHFETIPKVGMKAKIFGETAYVTGVNTEYDKAIKVTVEMSKNFNRLAEVYSGLKSNYRAYDVSEKQSYICDVSYGEDVIIGDPVEGSGETMIPPFAQSGFWGVFTGSAVTTPMTAAVVIHKNKNGDELSRVMVPVSARAIGRSLAFTWKYLDNYGAEYQSIYDSRATGRAMRNVRIGNLNGQFYTADVKLIPYLGYDESSADIIYPQIPHELPAFNYGNDYWDMLSDYVHVPDLLIDKDNREQITATLQLHFRTNRRNTIIGSGLARFHRFVRRADDLSAPKLYYFTELLNCLDSVVTNEFISNYGTQTTFAMVTGENPHIGFSGTATAPAVSWGIVQDVKDADGNTLHSVLILGENINIAAGEKPGDVYFTFRDKAV